MTSPRLDAHLAAHGETVEDLSDVTAAQPSPTAQPTGAGTGTSGDTCDVPVTLDLLRPTQFPSQLASWIGLGPAWSLVVEPERLSRQLLLDRLADPSAPPHGTALPALRRNSTSSTSTVAGPSLSRTPANRTRCACVPIPRRRSGSSSWTSPRTSCRSPQVDLG